MGTRDIWEISVSFSFYINLKLLQKLKVFHLKKEQKNHIFYSKKWVIFYQYGNFGIPLIFNPALYMNHMENKGYIGYIVCIKYIFNVIIM